MEAGTQSTPVVRKRTRADVYRERIEIRLAADAAGPLIADILRENGIELDGADFSRVYPHWLIAYDRDAASGSADEAIGCLQLLPSKPIGYAEFLFTRPSVPFKFRAIAVLKLTEQAWGTLMMAGCSYIAGSVDFKNRKFKHILEQQNFVPAIQADVMVKRLVGAPRLKGMN